MHFNFFLQGNNEKDVLFMNVKALNEWDSKMSGNVDWRQKLDSQRGAVLVSTLFNIFSSSLITKRSFIVCPFNYLNS